MAANLPTARWPQWEHGKKDTSGRPLPFVTPNKKPDCRGWFAVGLFGPLGASVGAVSV